MLELGVRFRVMVRARLGSVLGLWSELGLGLWSMVRVRVRVMVTFRLGLWSRFGFGLGLDLGLQ